MWRYVSRSHWKKIPKLYPQLMKFRDCSEKEKLAKETLDINYLKDKRMRPLYILE